MACSRSPRRHPPQAMREIPGPPPVGVREVLRAQDRLSFLYLERCVIHRDANAITATDERGTVHIPAATMSTLLLGPGCTVSHQAMVLMAESGSTAVWVGERGVRYYAHGRGLARSASLLQAQAEAYCNKRSRLRVARAMYEMRFPAEADVARLTMQQLRGREGVRVRQMYRDHAQRTGVKWTKRNYDMTEFASGDAINQAISAATTCLYGIVHAVVVAMGCSPGLGFVHTGHDRAFVYDVADLYKAEVAVPVAFDVVIGDPEDVPAETRRAVRDAVHDGKILVRCAKDIRKLLLPDEDWSEELDDDPHVVQLWDGGNRSVAGGVNYPGTELW